jgi:hypothetical protein
MLEQYWCQIILPSKKLSDGIMSAENPEPEDTLMWVVLIIGVIMFLVLAYATVILWTGANPVP